MKDNYMKNYRRTKKGMSGRIYETQVKSSKRRGHSLPTYSLEELREWLYSQPKFHKLYDNWKRLDYQSDYRPSVDRKNDYIGYTMANIQLMTFGQNKAKGDFDRLNGINNKQSKEVRQYTKGGELVAIHNSTMDAHRNTNINRAHINSCCLENRKSAGGYIWSYEVLVGLTRRREAEKSLYEST